MNMLPRLSPATSTISSSKSRSSGPGRSRATWSTLISSAAAGDEESNPRPTPSRPDELNQVLGKTLGVPLFQEQAMKIAMVAAGFRRRRPISCAGAMATFRRVGTIESSRTRWSSRMVARGYDADFAARCFDQIKGFGEYGFPESHAASFAQLVYVSTWLKCHFPAAFAARCSTRADGLLRAGADRARRARARRRGAAG